MKSLNLLSQLFLLPRYFSFMDLIVSRISEIRMLFKEVEICSSPIAVSDRIAHCYKYLAFSLIWIATMSSKYVIEHQDITNLPGEANFQFSIDLADLFHYTGFDRCSIPIVTVARKIFLR